MIISFENFILPKSLWLSSLVLSWTDCFLFKSLQSTYIGSFSLRTNTWKGWTFIATGHRTTFFHFYIKRKTLNVYQIVILIFIPKSPLLTDKKKLSNTKFVAPLKYKICNKQHTKRQCRRLQIVTNILHTKILKWKREGHPSTFTLLLFEQITKSN